MRAPAKVKNRPLFGRPRGRKQSGQIAVEYVLLLIVGVSIWLIVMRGLVSRDPNSEGLVIKKWQQIIQLIGGDVIENGKTK